MQAARLHVLPAADLAKAVVAPGYLWHDDVWRFPVTVAGTSQAVFEIRWAFEVEPGILFTAEKFNRLLEAWKRVVWCLFVEPGDSQQRRHSVCGKINTSLRALVPWMIATHRHDLSDLNQTCFTEYMTFLTDQKIKQALNDDLEPEQWDQQGITAQAMSPYFQIFNYAWWARHALAEVGLPYPRGDSDPLGGRAAIDLARDVCLKVHQATPEIPDEIFIPIMNKTMSLIGDPVVEPLISLCNALPDLAQDEIQERCRVFAGRHLEEFNPSNPATEAVRNVISRVRTACGIAVQGLTGIRISELCGVLAGSYDDTRCLPTCVKVERVFDDEYELFYLAAELFKGTSGSEPATWILGLRPTGSNYLPLPVVALDVLYRMDAGWRHTSRVPAMLVGFTNRRGIPATSDAVVSMLSATVRYWQQRWTTEIGCLPADARLSTHMWRKTFARYMVRASAGLLPALQHHFKHMSAAFTEVAYCQPNPVAREIISDARVGETGNIIFGLITGKKSVAGPIAKELAELAIELNGRFGNRPAAEYRDDIEDEVRTRNIQLYGSEFGLCVFRGDGARCHLLAEDPRLPLLRLAPAFAKQTPDICQGCMNFGISAEHEGFWKARKADYEIKLAACGPQTPAGLRSVLGRQIARCNTVLGWMGKETTDASA